MISLIKLLLEEINNIKIYGTVHKGGIILWTIVDGKDDSTFEEIKLKTKELRDKLNKSKFRNLLTPIQMFLTGYRSVKNQDGFILDTSISTVRDLTPKQIDLIKQFVEKEGYEIKNIFQNS